MKIEVDEHGASWVGRRSATIADYKERVAELETECATSKQMEAALIQAAHRLAELGDGREHPVRAAIEAALNAYSPAVEE